jgi:glycerol-3-phosphate dehydrogenase
VTTGITVAVLGSGREACELARSRALVGHLVRVYAAIEDASAAHARIHDAVALLSGEERQRLLDSIVVTSDLEEALEGAAVVIDARHWR